MELKRILAFIALGLLLFLGIKFGDYYGVHNEVYVIKKSAIHEYIDLYLLENGVVPKDLNELTQFVKEKDSYLYDKLQELGIHYLKTGDKYQLYHNGYDGKDNALSSEYVLEDVDFFKSLFIKGDILLNNSLTTEVEEAK